MLPLTVSCFKRGTSGDDFGNMRGELSADFVQKMAASPEQFIVAFFGTQSTAGGASSGVVISQDFFPVQRLFTQNKMRFATSLFSSCNGVVSGNQTDADGDSIPVDAAVNYNCQSGNQNFKGGYRLRDLDDTKPLPAGGLRVDVTAITGVLANLSQASLPFSLSPSFFTFNYSPTSTTLEWSSLGSMSSGSAQLTFGSKGNAAYSGDVKAVKAGDHFTSTSLVRFGTAAVPNFTNENLVAQLVTNGTVGVCSANSKLQVKDAEITLTDASGNIVRLSIADCVGSVTFNGSSLAIRGNAATFGPLNYSFADEYIQ